MYHFIFQNEDIMDPKYIIFFCGLINICLGQQNGRVSKDTKILHTEFQIKTFNLEILDSKQM